MTTTVTGLLCRRDFHPLEWQLASLHRILAYITGSVDRELLLRNEYLAAENRILRTKLNRRLQFSDAERATKVAGWVCLPLGDRAFPRRTF